MIDAVIGSAWELFERVADDYDEVVPFFAQFGVAIVETIDPPPGCRFLDLGAGHGALTGPALGRGCRVTALDAAPAMCARLRAAHPDVDVRVMDAQALDFAPDTFDLVASAFVIHLLDDPAGAVAEVHRVLAPGGRFAFTGGSARGRRGEAPPSSSLGSRLDGLFLEFTPHLRPGGGMGRPVDAADLLEAAGFVELREDHAAVAIRFPDNEALWRWMLTHGYRAFVEDLPTEPREQFRRRVLELAADDRVLHRTTAIWSGRKAL